MESIFGPCLERVSKLCGSPETWNNLPQKMKMRRGAISEIGIKQRWSDGHFDG